VLGTTLDAGTKVQSSSRVGQLGTRSQLRLVGTHILLWRLSALSSYIYIRIHTCIWPCLVMLNGDHTCNLMEPVRVRFFRASDMLVAASSCLIKPYIRIYVYIYIYIYIYVDDSMCLYMRKVLSSYH
jgi:hypothetical protein